MYNRLFLKFSLVENVFVLPSGNFYLLMVYVWISSFILIPRRFSEPYAGSDVARIRTTAKRTPDGKHFIVNGVKKWITGGCWADYFSVACQTDKGMSMLLIERGEGVETKIIKTSYSPSAGTAYITFENVSLNVIS